MSIFQFSQRFQLIFDNSNVNNDTQIKQKMANFFSALFRIIKFFFIILLKNATLESPFITLSCFPFLHKFFWNNFRHQNKNNVIETISCFVYQLSKKYCVNYMSEHLKYCIQIKEYWLKKCMSEDSIGYCCI